jgi:hypothetical protein
MVQKIISIIDSCKTYEQVETCRKWLEIVEINDTDRLACYGAIQLKVQQLQNIRFAKITGDNRFPVDDEHQEKH